MEHREKPSTDALKPERHSTDPETLATEADSSHENPPNQRPNPTTTPDPKAPEPPLGPMPAGWEPRLLDDGKVYFIDHVRRTTTWLDPRNLDAGTVMVGLPSGWEISQTKSGRMYFIDHHTRTTTWEDPRSTNTQAEEDPVAKPDDLSSVMGSGETQKGRTSLEDLNSPNRAMALRAKL